MQREEVELVIGRNLPSSQTSSARDSAYCEKDVSLIDPSCGRSLSQTATSKALPPVPTRRRHEAISIESALANEAFMSFRSQEKEQFEQISSFESSQRKALSAHHALLMKRLAAQHMLSKDEKVEQVRVSNRSLPHAS